MTRQLQALFTDASVEDAALLLSNLSSGVLPCVLQPHRDGVEQISDCLAQLKSLGRDAIAQVSILAHAQPGRIQLGNTELSLDSLSRYRDQLQQWFSGELSQASLALYACNLAAGDTGEEFLNKLQQATGTTIHASTTKIGHHELGGNWQLDTVVPATKPALKNGLMPFQAVDDWRGVLPITVTSAHDSGTDSLRRTVIFSSLARLQPSQMDFLAARFKTLPTSSCPTKMLR